MAKLKHIRTISPVPMSERECQESEELLAEVVARAYWQEHIPQQNGAVPDDISADAEERLEGEASRDSGSVL